MTLKVPPKLKAAILEKAAAAGMTANDYLAELAAKDTGVPYSNQEAMRLAG